MDRGRMDDLVAGAARAVKRGWLSALQQLRAQNTVDAIEARLRSSSTPVLGLDAAITAFATAERDALTDAGTVTARWVGDQLDRVRKKNPDFDASDPTVIAWERQNTLELIRGITEEQRDLIRQALERGRVALENPRVTATRIRDALGLTPVQEATVQSYREALERGRLAAALERQLSSGISDRAIAAAQRRGVELTPAQIDTAVERYRANAISLRAETIARTEGLRIANQGSEELYRQAVTRGDLTAAQIEREWIATRDPRTRDTHRAMNNQTRGFGEAFESPSGAQLRYPGDPSAPPKETINCRCVLTTRIRPARALGQAA